MKKKKWVKTRHAVVKKIVYLPIAAYCRLKYGLRVQKLDKSERRQSIILYNHQTGFDQFFVGLAVPGPIYYLASEDIFSRGWISSALRWLVAPIPIKKQSADIKGVMDCIRVAREGGTIAIAPEGNRTYSGSTAYINPAIAGLVKKLGIQVVFVRIEGGYGVNPRWSNCVRRGRSSVRVSAVMKPEEFRDLSDSELTSVIRNELYVNEAADDGVFRHRNSAEYLERCIYVCPDCGLSEFKSRRDEIECLKCNLKVKYLPTKKLAGVGREFPFRFVNDWYEYQSEYVSGLELSDYIEKPAYTDRVSIFKVIPYKRKQRLRKNIDVSLYGDRLAIESEGFSANFSEIRAISVLSKNKLNIYYNDNIYQLRGGKRFNALKYVNIFYASKNIYKENGNGKFMGI